MEKIFKTFRAEVKGVNPDTGEVDMYIPVSAASVDRDGEVVEPMAFKKTLPKFMKRPVLVASHDYRDLTSQIGEWSRLKITPEGMDGKPKYYINEGNEQADWGFKLASKGMAAFSIGFIPTKWEDGMGGKEPRRTYKEVELLEISQVIVPSNRDAIQGLRSKGFDDEVVNQLLDDVEESLVEEIETKHNNGDVEVNAPFLILQTKDLITKPEVTDNYVRIPVRECTITATVDIAKEQGIKGLYCGTEKKFATYLFATDKGWTIDKAKAWVKEHDKKDFNIEHEVSQEEIGDELCYVDCLIEKYGLNDENKGLLEKLYKRLTESDISEEIDTPLSEQIAEILKSMNK